MQLSFHAIIFLGGINFVESVYDTHDENLVIMRSSIQQVLNPASFHWESPGFNTKKAIMKQFGDDLSQKHISAT